MILKNEWMTNNHEFGDDYPNPKETIDLAEERYILQRDYSPEGYDVVIDGVNERVVIQEHANPLNKEKETKKLFCDKNSVTKTGSIMEVDEISQSFIVVSNVETNKGYLKSLVRLINNRLQYIDDDGAIQIHKCNVDYIARASTGVSENKHITTGNRALQCYINKNSDTKKLLARNGHRFIFGDGNGCFVLRDMNDYTNDGLIVMSFEEDEINYETDKQVLHNGELIWIADYTKAPTFNLSITTGDIELSATDTRQLEYSLTKDGLSADNQVTWSSSDELIATVDNNGLLTAVADGIVEIKCEMSGNADIFDEVSVLVTASPISNVTYAIEPNIDRITMGSEIEFTVKKYINGVESVVAYAFDVDASTTASSSQYSFDTVSADTFKIVNEDNGGKLVIGITPSGDSRFTKEYELAWFK